MLKSVIYPVNGVLVPNLEELANILCSSTGNLPTTYLGLPFGAKFKSADIWSGVTGKIGRKLANWQMQCLSMGSRLTLISSVLDDLPTYLMSLFPIPGKVLKQIDKYRRNFLWEGNSKTHKFHLVKWKPITQPKSQGGLGVRDLAAHNKSMLMKFLWRFSQEDNSL